MQQALIENKYNDADLTGDLNAMPQWYNDIPTPRIKLSTINFIQFETSPQKFSLYKKINFSNDAFRATERNRHMVCESVAAVQTKCWMSMVFCHVSMAWSRKSQKKRISNADGNEEKKWQDHWRIQDFEKGGFAIHIFICSWNEPIGWLTYTNNINSTKNAQYLF